MKNKHRIVTRRPLIDCTLSKSVPSRFSKEKLQEFLKAMIAQATNMLREKMAEISFSVKGWICKMTIGFRKELRHHVYGYVLEIEIDDCKIICVVDRQVLEEPSLLLKIRWKYAVEKITPAQILELFREHLKYRATLD